MAELTLEDLVENGTMSPEIAAMLAATGRARRSFLTFALPRLAGKSTVAEAVLACAPEGTGLHRLSEEHGPTLGIPDEPAGYLVMSEIAETAFPHYLWGDPVRRIFGSLGAGFTLATSLHAEHLERAFEVICHENEIPDAEANALDLAVTLRSLGDDWREPEGRRVVAVHEIERVEHGRPVARLLARWDEATDRFEALDIPSWVSEQEFDELLGVYRTRGLPVD